MKTKTISLKVLEAYTRDAGRGVARIDYDSMDELNVSTGDVIEIKGKRRTVAKCLPLYPSDEGKGIMRIDALGRNNLEIAIGDTITVRKTKAIAAGIVILFPLGAIPSIDERYLTDALESVPLIKGNIVTIQYFGGHLSFQVIGVTPAADVVFVTRKTIFHISDKRKIQRSVISRSVILQNAGRTERIFSLMANQDRINILRISNLMSPTTHSELKSLAGFKSEKESGKFAYHLKKLEQESLVAYNKLEKRYTVTILGKTVCDLMEEIEKR